MASDLDDIPAAELDAMISALARKIHEELADADQAVEIV
jgi:hypothetical protein